MKDLFLSDFSFLIDNLPKLHKDLFALISKKEYESKASEILTRFKTKEVTIEEFEVILQELFSLIKDPHTKVARGRIKTPITFEWVSGAYYPFVVDERYKDMLGKRLLKINGMALDKFARLAKEYLVFDNDELMKIEIAKSLSDYYVVRHVTVSDSAKIRYTFEDTQIELTYSNVNEFIPKATLFHIKGNSFLRVPPYYSTKLIDNSLYIRYAKCKEDEKYSFSNFYAEIEKLIAEMPQKIIIDFRENSGGNSSFFEPVIKMIESYKNNHGAKIFGLINRKVFSSGTLNTYHIKDVLGALLVGQPSSQGGNHFGDNKFLILPKTGIEIMYSTKYFYFGENEQGVILPDVYIEPTIEDYLEGKDVVLEYCLTMPK